MKERLLRTAVVLFLLAVLVVPGVLPITSQAAAKGTTYNVVLQKGSVTLALVSINDGASAPSVGKVDGVSFSMVVGTKLLTEKVKSTGGKASYYEVTIPAKSYKSLTGDAMMPGGAKVITYSRLSKDAKGKLYVSGGDVDVSNVQAEKKLTSKIGDGKDDPKGSLLILFPVVSEIKYKDSGKIFMSTPMTTYFTTGKSYTMVKGSKSGLEGKAIPDNDTTNTLTKPLVGVSLDLEAGTGTMVATTGIMNQKNKTLGMMDYLASQIYIMKITK